MHRSYFLLLLLCINSFTVAANNIEIRTIDVSPYGIDSNGDFSGVYYDLANLLFSKEDKINHSIYPYARIVYELKSGNTDLTIMFKYKELENYVTYIAPLPPLQNVVVGIRGRNATSVDDLEGRSIAYLRGAHFSNEIENNSSITLYRTKTFKRSVEMLIAGRVDAVIGPFEALLMAAKSLGKNKDFFGEVLVVSERTPWLQVSNQSKYKFDIIELEKEFTNIIKNNKLEYLKKKYLP
jgi:polar amino acid transport system substrate-binding protein